MEVARARGKDAGVAKSVGTGEECRVSPCILLLTSDEEWRDDVAKYLQGRGCTVHTWSGDFDPVDPVVSWGLGLGGPAVAAVVDLNADPQVMLRVVDAWADQRFVPEPLRFAAANFDLEAALRRCILRRGGQLVPRLDYADWEGFEPPARSTSAGVRTAPAPGVAMNKFEENSGLVGLVVSKIAKQWGIERSSPAYEDLRQSAELGLVQALHGFNPEMGNKFSTYAVRVIKGTIQTWAKKVWRDPRDVSPDTRISSDDTDKRTLGDTLADDAPSGQPGIPEHGDTPTQLEAGVELLESVLDLAGLTEEERMVLSLRWGLDQGLQPRPRRAVARMLQLNGQRPFFLEGRNEDAKPRFLLEELRRVECRATDKLR